jgi:hypothetical protein
VGEMALRLRFLSAAASLNGLFEQQVILSISATRISSIDYVNLGLNADR